MKKLLLVALSTIAIVSTLPFGHAQTYTVLYNLGTQATDPYMPGDPGLIAQGEDGNLHSTATSGGTNTAGAAFVVTPSGSFTSIYDFSYGGGGYPYSGLTLASDGSLWGTTYNTPTIFKVTPQGGVTTMFAMTVEGVDGSYPAAPPTQGTDGNFYGTATLGGTNNDGTIYKITPSGTFTVLYTCKATDCYGPRAPLTQGSDGNFYGTSEYGGANGQGCIFRITPAGMLTVLYSFDYTHGSSLVAALVQGTDRNFYGTTYGGGNSGYGTIFKMTLAGVLTVLHNMDGFSDGRYLDSGLVQATDGNFYGVAVNGGSTDGYGSLFKITSAGVFAVLYDFDVSTGAYPRTTLLQHTNGLLYGTTQGGGSGSAAPCSVGTCGVIYSFNIGAVPFVSFVGAPVGRVGKSVEILGQGFTGATAVTFGKVPASYTVVSDTYLTAVVPAGATTAAVTVTTPAGRLLSNKKFRVTPQVKTFSPTSGAVGTPVTITGVSLTQATKVTFGGVAATSFTVNSDTQITATVPTGAVTGKITVTTPGGTASSSTNFTVTP